MGAMRTYLLFVAACATLLAAASTASAHGTENHDAPPAAGTTGGGANPGAIPTVDEPVTGGGAETPAAGAQPAAPGDLPPAVGGAGGNTTNTTDVVQPVATGTGTSSASTEPATTSMIESVSEPAISKPQTATGGGGFEDGVIEGGGAAVPDAPVATGAGDLPFTGIEETILLVALSGMLVPIGVLLYSFARHGEVRWLRRHLAAPRFQWAQAPGVRPDPNRWPDARA